MKKLLFILFILAAVFSARATHNRAGEITYRHISGLTYEVSVSIYADPETPAFSRTSIQVSWGDNTSNDSLNQPVITSLTDEVSKRTWTTRHTFPGAGDYVISVTDQNRNSGVENIRGSVNVAFHIESLLRISQSGSISNNSPVLLNDPIDDACVGAKFVHNPGAYDVDGDSLAYRLAQSKDGRNSVAPGFYFPSASNELIVDEVTGDLIWDTPEQPGEYNMAIRILEYRNGVLIGNVLRDLQIDVKAGCNNQPPDITLNRYVCTEANQTFSETIRGTDPNGDNVALTATGELLETSPNPAVFNATAPSEPTTALLNWIPNCEQVRITPYSVSIKAEDDATTRGQPNLTSFASMEVRVIAPAVQNFTAQSTGRNITLNWDASICNNAQGYYLYRRFDSSGFVPSQCQVGVPAFTNYERIARIRNIGSTSYIDSNGVDQLVPGRKYCYLITAYFSDGDESYASTEVCEEIEKYVPIMTNVTINSTSEQGEIGLAWSPPDTIDSQAFPPPYLYNVYQVDNGQRQLLGTTPSLNDTTFVVNTINTEVEGHSFSVELESQSAGSVGESPRAESIFLTLQANDNRVNLNWSDNTPWRNYSYTIFRRLASSSSPFDSIATTTLTNYVDDSLTNDSEYCYFIRSTGRYDITTVNNPLINFSQENCAIPIDREPPCSPIFEISSNCDSNYVQLTWLDSIGTCASDIVKYRIYKSPSLEEEGELLEEISVVEPKEYSSQLRSIAGCYRVVAVDSAGNESFNSIKKCIDYCPRYDLPNIFTPNGDLINDEFVPLPNYRYVDSIDLKIFNRWGRLVFETNNPEINWNAIDMRTDEMVEAGTYYYVCIVYELSLEGIKPRTLKGTVNVHEPSTINNER